MNISTKKNEEDFVTIYTNATLKIEKKNTFINIQLKL